jgi:hypothetical protein
MARATKEQKDKRKQSMVPTVGNGGGGLIAKLLPEKVTRRSTVEAEARRLQDATAAVAGGTVQILAGVVADVADTFRQAADRAEEMQA